MVTMHAREIRPVKEGICNCTGRQVEKLKGDSKSLHMPLGLFCAMSSQYIALFILFVFCIKFAGLVLVPANQMPPTH